MPCGRGTKHPVSCCPVALDHACKPLVAHDKLTEGRATVGKHRVSHEPRVGKLPEKNASMSSTRQSAVKTSATNMQSATGKRVKEAGDEAMYIDMWSPMWMLPLDSSPNKLRQQYSISKAATQQSAHSETSGFDG